MIGTNATPQPYHQRTLKGGWKVQTAVAKTLPIVIGTKKVGGNIAWMGDRQAVHYQAGKGIPGAGGGSGGQTFYNESLLITLCEGLIDGIGRVWRTGTASATVKPENVLKNWTFILGALGQSPLSYLTSNHPGMDLGYSGIAYAFRSGQPMGASTTPPQFSWEVYGRLIAGTITYANLDNTVVQTCTNPDANPADIIDDLLTNTQYAAFWPTSLIGSLTSFSDYCAANNLFLSLALDTATKVSEVISRILKLCNADLRWSNGVMTIVPFGDLPRTANGKTFTPDLAPVYTFTSDDFKSGELPRVTIERPADMFNRFGIEFENRANNYDPESMYEEVRDQIELYGVRQASILSAHEISTPLTARLVLLTQMQRSISVIRSYECTVPWRYYMLDPLDIVGLVDPRLGLGLGVAMVGSVGTDAGGSYITLLSWIDSPDPVTEITEIPNVGDWIVDKATNTVTQLAAPGGGASNTTGKLYLTSTTGFSPGDCVAVAPVCVRINEIEEDKDSMFLSLKAEDLGVNTPAVLMAETQPRGGNAAGDADSDPTDVNTPLTFEPPARLSKAAGSSNLGFGEVWITANGLVTNDSQHGGYTVWYSEDNSTFDNIGSILGRPVIGTLVSTLASHSDPDAVNTLSIDLGESEPDGITSLTGISNSLADKFHNLAIIDNEIISFASVAAGAGDHQYNLTYLRRGLFGTMPASHSTSAKFLFLGQPSSLAPGVFRFKYPVRAIGTTVYFKLTSLNTQAGNQQDVSAVTSHALTLGGGSLAPLDYSGVTADGLLTSAGLVSSAVGVPSQAVVSSPVSLPNNTWTAVATIALSPTIAIGDLIDMVCGGLAFDSALYGQLVDIKFVGAGSGTIYWRAMSQYIDPAGNLDASVRKKAPDTDLSMRVYLRQYTGGAVNFDSGTFLVINQQSR